MKQQDNAPTDGHIALIEQVLTDVRELRKEFKEDRKELWVAINALRESITGNGKIGLSKQVDWNTNFRKFLTRLLWVLFTPLYAGVVALLIKFIFEK